MAVLWRERHDLLATRGLQQDRWRGHVPIMPVFFHDLEAVPVVACIDVENDDRVAVTVVALACSGDEIRSRITSRDVHQPVLDIEREGSPDASAGDRYALRVFPRRSVERRLAQRAADDVAFTLGHHEELPEDLAGLQIERV